MVFVESACLQGSQEIRAREHRFFGMYVSKVDMITL